MNPNVFFHAEGDTIRIDLETQSPDLLRDIVIALAKEQKRAETVQKLRSDAKAGIPTDGLRIFRIKNKAGAKLGHFLRGLFMGREVPDDFVAVEDEQ